MASPTTMTTDGPWIPRAIAYVSGEPVVDLVQLAAPPPAFLSDLDLRYPRASRQVPLMAAPRSDPRRAPTGFIFHLPRSGSTLTARMLTRVPSSACVIEPEAINALLSSPDAGSLRAAWLRRLGELYATALAGSYRHVFVKLSSWVILRAPLFAEAFPHGRGCFVHRAPEEVVGRLLERPTGWMADHAHGLILGREMPPERAMSREEYCARALGRFCEAARHATPWIRSVAYEDLPQIVPEIAVQHFGLDLDRDDRRAMLDVTHLDSEDWSMRRPFDRTRDGAGARTTPALEGWLQQFAHEPRQALLREGRSGAGRLPVRNGRLPGRDRA